MFFCGKKGFLQVLLIPEIAVCSERVIWVGINMEKGSSARRDPLTYWVTLMSGKGGLFPGQGGLGKVCWGPLWSFSASSFFPPVKLLSPSLQGLSFPLWSLSLLLCKAFLFFCPLRSFSALAKLPRILALPPTHRNPVGQSRAWQTCREQLTHQITLKPKQLDFSLTDFNTAICRCEERKA